MTNQKKKITKTIYQLKITLKGCHPTTWRRVLVRADSTLKQLHWIIQFSMGWLNSHLHSFNIHAIEYGERISEWGFDDDQLRDEETVKLNKIISKKGFKFSYLYDFGDSWEHEILVEDLLEANPEIDYPICIEGKHHCPPEDCGGVWGFQDFLNAIQDPNHPEHEEMLEWVGGVFDPEDAELDEANYLLKNIPA